MGIREHFEEMKDKKEVMKLSDLSYDVETKELVDLDFTDELKDVEWQEIGNKIIDQFRGSWYDIALYVCIAKRAFSDIDKLDIDLNEEFWRGLKEDFDEAPQSDPRVLSLQLFRLLFPQRIDELDLDNTFWQSIVDEYSGSGYGEKPRYLTDLKSIAIFDRNRLSNIDIDIDKYYWERIKEDLESAWDWEILGRGNEGKMIKLINRVLALKIVFPDKASELVLGQNGLQKIRETAELCRKKKDWLYFLRLAAGLKVLAAERIDIVDGKFEYVFPEEKSFKQEKTKRPERRQF